MFKKATSTGPWELRRGSSYSSAVGTQVWPEAAEASLASAIPSPSKVVKAQP